MSKIILFNKPFGVLTQFSDSEERKTLADYITEKGVYAAGRLDKDSEGLVVLTDDGKLQHRITSPRHKISKTYWVQVEGEPEEKSLDKLREGIELKDGMTKPAKVRLIQQPYLLWGRNPPIRVRKTVSDSWLEITLVEGRNRQVRRMTAAVGYPTLRLIRYRVGSWTIDGLKNGDWKLLEG